ncbi:MAG: hypothetical protein SFV15_12290 [Polyangiaceae bacterium]|nr:hypothetical protein [Polyangiaceae bacterium]
MSPVKTACGAWCWCLLIVAAGACGPAGKPAPTAGPLKTSWLAPMRNQSSEWRYHPKKPATMRATFAVGADTVLAGDRGERWLIEPGRAGVRTAPMLAPEMLVDVVNPEPQAWWFIGASGTVYQAASPLGPFVRSASPQQPLAQVAAAPAALLGVTQRGALVLSRDGGVVWDSLKTDGARFVDVAVNSDGRALALSVPERLWSADLPDLRFTPLDLAPVGALSLETVTGDLQVVGLYERYALTRERRLEPLEKSAPSTVTGFTPPLGPDAAALVQGRASLDGGVYAEAREGENGWDLVSGRLGEDLQRRRLPGTSECKMLKLAAAGSHIYFACGAATGGGTQELLLYRSQDSGLHFEREPYVVLGNTYSLRMATGRQGHLLVTGICDLGDTATSCQPNGVFVRAPNAQHKLGRRLLRRALLPGLRGTAQAVTFSSDGVRAYAIGARNRSQQPALFLSQDAGVSFDTSLVDSRENGPNSGDRTTGNESLGTAVRAASGPNNTLAVSFDTGSKQIALIFDQNGQLLARATPPETARVLAAAGTSLVAWSETTGIGYITLDAGASWQSLGPLPANLCEPGQRCSPAIACETSGCVFSDTLTRLGWGLPSEPNQPLLRAPEASTPRTERHVRTAISCQLGADPWRPLEGAAYAPEASDAAIGEVDWMVPAVKAADRAVEVLHQRGEKLERKSLLAKVPDPSRYAFNVYSQIEGVAAIRYPLPTPERPTLSNIEVAWANYFTKAIVHQAKLPTAGPYLPGDYKQSERDPKLNEAMADLVSIAEGGVFVRPHKSPEGRQITYFLDGRSVQQLGPVKWPKSQLDARLASEIAVVGGQFLPLLLESDGAMVVRARAQGDTFEFAPMTTGLLSPQSSQLLQRRSVVYLNGAAALYVHQEDAFGTFSEASAFPFQALGAPVGAAVRVPTQLQAGDPPSPCGAPARANTPRTISLLTGGTRHPVLITEGTEPLRTLLTNNAVMYGTLAEPCVATFDAQPLKEDRSLGERALVAPGNGAHSWLFRRQPGDEQGPTRIEYHSMQCLYDPAAQVPEEVFEAVGTRREPRP